MGSEDHGVNTDDWVNTDKEKQEPLGQHGQLGQQDHWVNRKKEDKNHWVNRNSCPPILCFRHKPPILYFMMVSMLTQFLFPYRGTASIVTVSAKDHLPLHTSHDLPKRHMW